MRGLIARVARQSQRVVAQAQIMLIRATQSFEHGWKAAASAQVAALKIEEGYGIQADERPRDPAGPRPYKDEVVHALKMLRPVGLKSLLDGLAPLDPAIERVPPLDAVFPIHPAEKNHVIATHAVEIH